MKKFKKIIPAFCMLLVSAVMLGGTTFAWFTMNTNVKATDMVVNAKSNATYLLINTEDKSGNDATTTLTNTANATYVDNATNADKKVYPVTYIKQLGDATKIGNVTLKDTYSTQFEEWKTQNKHWFTANNGNSGNANNNVVNVKPVDITTEKNYRLEYNVWLTLSKSSEAVSKKIKVSATVVGDEAVKAVVTIAGAGDLAVANGTNETTAAEVSLSSATAVKVTVYVYVDGESVNVNSDYLNGDILSGTLSLDFDLVD